MPPTSSPVHRLSSASSAASTVITIASRSPPHPFATSPRVREGRSPRPLLGDVIATPRHHLATDRPATSSARAAPRRSAILPTSSSSPSLLPGGEGRASSLRACEPLPLTLPTLSTLPGCVRIYADTSGGGRGSCRHIRGAALVRAIQSFGNFCASVSL